MVLKSFNAFGEVSKKIMAFVIYSSYCTLACYLLVPTSMVSGVMQHNGLFAVTASLGTAHLKNLMSQ